MIKTLLLLLTTLVPILWISPLAAQDLLSAPAAEEKIEKKMPLLSFYYFDG